MLCGHLLWLPLLGFFTQGQRLAAKPFELQADCVAGSWGNSVYRAGKLKPGDVEAPSARQRRWGTSST